MREIVNSDELKGARIRGCDLSGAELRGVMMPNARIIDAWLVGADISGEISGLKVNGVEVAPLVEAELDRRHPERTALRPTDGAGVLNGYDVVEAMWSPTIERARRLPEARLQERVHDEYSFVETLRHLLFASDAWLRRMVLQVPLGYHEWAVPPDLDPLSPNEDGPGLDDVLAVRAERIAELRAWLAGATDADLQERLDPPDPVGHPQGRHRPIDCFQVVLMEEWWHHQYATRDLTALERRSTST